MAKKKRGYTGTTTPEEERDLMQTPHWLFLWMDRAFGPFDIDLACNSENCLVREGDGEPIGYLYDRGANALTAEHWPRNGVGFCNPPYSDITPWILKAEQEAAKGFTTVFVLPSLNGDKWQDLLDVAAAEIYHVVGRISFISPTTGKPRTGNNRGTVIAVVRRKAVAEGARHFMLIRDEIRGSGHEGN